MRKQKLLKIGFLSLFIILNSVAFAVAQDELREKLEELADKLASTSEGKVIGVENAIIYINLGEKDTIYPGARFEVVRLGDPMIVGKKYICLEAGVNS